MKTILSSIFLLLTTAIFSQELGYSSVLLPKELMENSNSVIRDQSVVIDIVSRKQMIIKKVKVITVLNKKGLTNIDAIEFYNNSTKVRTIEAIIYNAFGKELKKIKRRDFVDQSVADGFSIYNDERKLFLDYTPTEYPFTIVYTSEVETSNTAFIPKWFPIDDYYESVQKTSIQIKYPPDLGFKYKENNVSNQNILKEESANQITFSAKNLKAGKFEEYSPSFIKMNPSVLFGLDLFYLEGVEGNGKTWEEFGKWVYTSLLKDTEQIPESTIQKIKALVGDEKDPLNKAKIIYKFLQEHSRYVSIQLGIGGWKPMLAADVDRLGYGDCKALSNYARVLLQHVGVESYYTVLYAGNSKQNISEDFVSMQGNHAILSIPVGNRYVSLECTSQTSPFGFNGDFTDDRYVLIIKPEGGEIIKTNDYNAIKNSQSTTGNYIINAKGDLEGTVQIKSKGIQYDDIYPIEKLSILDKDIYYKERFGWINNLKINKIELNNNKEQIEFHQNVELTAEKYASLNNDMLLFPINVFNRSLSLPQRYKLRENAFEIERGFFDEDIVDLNLPEGFVIDAKPNDVLINSTFGSYKMEIVVENAQKVKFKRSYLLNEGLYQKENYDEFRKFTEQIYRADNAKMILKKTTN